VREFPPEFASPFGYFADEENSRFFAEDSPPSNRRLPGKLPELALSRR